MARANGEFLCNSLVHGAHVVFRNIFPSLCFLKLFFKVLDRLGQNVIEMALALS